MANFWDKVNKSSGCWEWSGAKRDGYGVYRDGKKTVGAHRYSYELEYGFIPRLLRHKCDNPSCVRPDHLEPGEHKDNSLDMKLRDRGFSRLTNVNVIEARTRAAGGESIYLIIKDMPKGVSLTSLSNAIRGKTFKHLAGEVDSLSFEHRIYNKLSDKEYKEIIDDLNNRNYRGQGKDLAVKYGVHPSLITLIKKDKLKTIRRVSFE
jgi:hypothetical protein